MADVFPNDSFINDTEDNSTSLYPILEIDLSSTVRFWIILIFEIPSLICSLFLLYTLCFDRTLRKALNNHVIIILLIVGLFSQTIDVPNYLTFLRLGYVWPQTSANCYAWWLFGSMSYTAVGLLMTWASIERHILVFHHQWLNTQKKRIFFHYIPLATIILYSCIFYGVCILSPPCQNTVDYTQLWCNSPCYDSVITLSTFDVLVNSMLPSLLLIISNIFLFVRAIKQKQRLRQQVQWQKYRRMMRQLASCSLLFLLFNFPMTCLTLAQIFGLPIGATGELELFIYLISYFFVLWMPFVCLGSSPEIWIKMKRMMRVRYARNRIAVQTFPMTQQQQQQQQK